MSASSSPTERPRLPKARASPRLTVDLPTPPFPLATATSFTSSIVPSKGCGCSGDVRARSRTRVSVSSVTEKAFLDGYRGQTLDELLTMTDTYREDSIILAIE